MFNRKFSSNIRRKKRMIISSIILLVVFLGIGYSAFTTNLGINGTLDVSKYDQTLYGVLEKAAKKGTYAKEYTGNHQDSMAGVGTQKIYHWYGSSNDNGTAILDMNNVIFADHCWQMVRTTDTGGVKMIYNGEPENGQCLNTRGNHVGYDKMTTTSLATTYYYGTSYTYDKTNSTFSLGGTITTGTIKEGEYTCRSTSQTGTCTTLYLVDSLLSGTTYNVLPINSSSHYSQFGKLQFNINGDSPAYVGYMYNKSYSIESYSYHHEVAGGIALNINDSYYYSDEIDYGNISANRYTLINSQLISTLNDYNNLVGKYFLKEGGNGSSDGARYIVAVRDNKIYVKYLENGNLNTSMMVGDAYTDNGNGTYTINNPIQISYIDWYNGEYLNCNNKYVCDGLNSTCSDLKKTVDSRTNTYYYFDIRNNYKYSESVSYSNGTYTLNGDVKTIWDFSIKENRDIIATHHYTCMDNGLTCTTVNYVTNYNANSAKISYIVLNNIADISSALDEMLNSNGINQNDSTIKKGIDAWYKRYLLNYDSKLEDAIFCNDRSVESLGPFNPNGGDITYSLQFRGPNYYNNDLSCANDTDKFSLSNSKASLQYPIGLLTYEETKLLNNDNIRKTGNSYWNIASSSFSVYVINYYVESLGRINYAGSITNSNGVRPVISLKPGTEYASGTGSMAKPYVVE